MSTLPQFVPDDSQAITQELIAAYEAMTGKTLAILAQGRKGFLAMIEGGRIDHAAHVNDAPAAIRDTLAFDDAVGVAMAFASKNPGTLLIVTADHETGCLWGPNSDTVAFDPIVDQGKGKQPLVKYNSGGHTNSLIPLFAKGAGADEFLKYAVGKDPVRGAYLNNIDIFKVISSAATKR